MQTEDQVAAGGVGDQGDAALTGTSIDNATRWANFAKRNWTDHIASRKDP